mgnify:FL=1
MREKDNNSRPSNHMVGATLRRYGAQTADPTRRYLSLMHTRDLLQPIAISATLLRASWLSVASHRTIASRFARRVSRSRAVASRLLPCLTPCEIHIFFLQTKKIPTRVFGICFAYTSPTTATFKGVGYFACMMLSKRDENKGYVFVKDDSYPDRYKTAALHAKREREKSRMKDEKAAIAALPEEDQEAARQELAERRAERMKRIVDNKYSPSDVDYAEETDEDKVDDPLAGKDWHERIAALPKDSPRGRVRVADKWRDEKQPSVTVTPPKTREEYEAESQERMASASSAAMRQPQPNLTPEEKERRRELVERHKSGEKNPPQYGPPTRSSLPDYNPTPPAPAPAGGGKVSVKQSLTPKERKDAAREEREERDYERSQDHQAFLAEQFDSMVAEGDSPVEAIQEMLNLIGERFSEVTNMTENEHKFMREYRESPIITPAMSEFFMGKLADEEEEVDEELERMAITPTVKDEQIPFDLSMLDPFKIPRPDKAVESLHWNKYDNGDDHPVTNLMSDFLGRAIDNKYYDLDAAIQQADERKAVRAKASRDKSKNTQEAGKGFENEETSLKDAYENLFPLVGRDGSYKPPPEKQEWVNKMREYVERKSAKDTSQERDYAFSESGVQPEGPEEAASKRSRHVGISQTFRDLQQRITEHARAAFGSNSIGAVQRLEGWGRAPQEAGSDPIMTPIMAQLATELGVSVDEQPNSPDIMAMMPLQHFIGGNEVNPLDPQYHKLIQRFVIASTYEESDDVSLKDLHPAIKSAPGMAEAVYNATGDTSILAEGGFDTGVENDRAGMVGHDGRGISHEGGEYGTGTTITSFAETMVDAQGNSLWLNPDSDEYKQMNEAERKTHDKKVSNAFSRKLQQWRKSGKGIQHRSGRIIGDEQEQTARDTARRYEETAEYVKHKKSQWMNGVISEEEYNMAYGNAIIQGGDGLKEYLSRGEDSNPELPEVEKGHYLYADADGNKLDEEGRRKKLDHAFNMMVGVAGVLRSAKTKLENSDQATEIANEEDLGLLFKIPSAASPLTDDERDKISSFHAAGITKEWWSTQLGKNRHLRDGIRESGFSTEDYIKMAASTMGSNQSEVSKDSVRTAMGVLVKQMGMAGGKYSGATAGRILNNLIRRKDESIENELHHGKTMNQTEYINSESEDDDEKQTCVGCVGSPSRTTNVGDKKGGGKSNMTSPYSYGLEEVPNLDGVERIGPPGDTNLMSVYHALMNFGNDEDGWDKAYNIIDSMDNWSAKNMVGRELSKRRREVGEKIQKTFGLGMRVSRTNPRGIARDIENDPAGQEFYRHYYPSDSVASEKQTSHDRTVQQRKDLAGALKIYRKTAGKVAPPTPFDEGGEISRGQKTAYAKRLLSASGLKQITKAKKQLDGFMYGHTKESRVEGREGKKYFGYNEMRDKFREFKIDQYIENQKILKPILGIRRADRTELQESSRVKLEERQKEIRAMAENTLSSNRMSADTKGENKGKGQVDNWLTSILPKSKKNEKPSWTNLSNAYFKMEKDKIAYELNLKTAEKNKLFDFDNANVGTLSSLHPQIEELARFKGTPEEKERKLDELHSSVFMDDRGLNTRKRFKVNQKSETGTLSVGEDFQDTLEDNMKGGLRGRMGETAGSALDYSMGAYHIPSPTSYDEAIALLKQKGIALTDSDKEMLRDRYNDKRATEHDGDWDSMMENEAKNVAKDKGYFTEKELAKKNQAYTDVNKVNFTNKTGGPSRCGTCAGNTEVSMDEFVTYAKAHHDKLKGASIDSPEMSQFILKHARPAGYDSFDNFNDSRSGADVPHMDHNLLACPDCEHHHPQVGEAGGKLSDGICSHCLGDGEVMRGDKYLKEQIQQHPHKTPSSANMRPEDLQQLMSMEKARQAKTGGYKTEADLASMLSTNPIEPIAMLLSSLKENQFPNIATPQEVDEAHRANRLFDQRRHADVVNAHINGTSPEDEAAKRKARPNQRNLTDYGSRAMRGATLGDLLQSSGKKALGIHLDKLVDKARYMVENGELKNEKGEEKSALISKIKTLADDVKNMDYSAFGDYQSAGHSTMRQIEKLIHNSMHDKVHTNHRMLLAGNAIEGFDEMTDAQKKKQKSNIYSPFLHGRNKDGDPIKRTYRFPHLTHHKGRMLTDDEYDQINHFQNEREAVIQKTPNIVRNFFSDRDGDRSLIARAFNTVGSNWANTKKQEEKEMTDFLGDMDGVISRNESPFNKSVGSTLPPNREYLALKKELGLMTDDDDLIHNLRDGNMFHPSLEHHTSNARKWLAPYTKKGDEWVKGDPLHTRVHDDIKKKARDEWVSTAKLRATKEFFRQNNVGTSSNYGLCLGDDGNPMTLEEFKKMGHILPDKKEQSMLEKNINDLICDSKGRPVDLDDSPRELYHIKTRDEREEVNEGYTDEDGNVADRGGVTKMPAELTRYGFDDYYQKRVMDAEFKYEPVSMGGLGIENREGSVEDQAPQTKSILDMMKKYMEIREKTANDTGMSNEKARKIVGAANKFYDMYHYPNFFLEQELQKIAHSNGVELEDLGSLQKTKPELFTEAKGTLSHIQAMHPTWTSYEITAMQDYNHAQQLHYNQEKEREAQKREYEEQRQRPQRRLSPELVGDDAHESPHAKEASYNAITETPLHRDNTPAPPVAHALRGDNSFLHERNEQGDLVNPPPEGQSSLIEYDDNSKLVNPPPVEEQATMQQRLAQFAQQQAQQV